ncbi:MAG: S9 family peptidase [Terriglobia bacterium]
MNIRVAIARKILSGRAGFALSLAAFVVVSAAPLVAGDEVFTPYHVAKLRQVAEAAISPNGTQVAYVLRIPRQPGKDTDGPAWEELHLVNENGVSRPFVTGQVNVSKVAWTPGGKGISFLAKRSQDEHKTLYVIPVDGGEARRVLSHGADVKEYSWSPDGRRVAFLAEEALPKEKKKLKEKGFNQQVYEEEVRPVRVWIAAVDGEDLRPRALDLPGSASELHWSPAGARLAVALAPTPLIDDHYMKRTLHLVDADTGEIVARLDNPGKLGQVAWSPDGQQLAIISAADRNDPREGRLMVASASGGALRNLLPDYQGHVSRIAWQDAETLMFLGDEGVWTTCGEVRRDASGRKTIIPAGGPVLTDFSLAGDAPAAAFIGERPRHPREVFFMKHGDAGPQRLTQSNPWLAEMRFAPQEVVSFTARDGLRLEGILIRPLNPEEGKRYPLILRVHGGPEAHYRNGWLTSYTSPGQVGAAAGFAVFYPNYRGSTGRGVAFSKRDQGDPAGKEFDDLVDGVDHLVALGLVDRDRVGITGGSYGGYASAWGATYYSERFAASVMFVGISDQVSKIGTTDIANEMYLVHFRQWLWQDWQFFLERSPIYYAHRSRTPTLILHGKDDTRVHPSQSMELYRHLKLRGRAPVRLVFYPGEKHGNRRAAPRLDYNLCLLRWMEHYLKGPGGDPPAFELNYEKAKPEESAEE